MKRLFATLAAAGIIAGIAAPSYAAPMIRLTSGATVVTVTDNLAGDLSAEAGAVTYVGPIGEFTTTVTAGLTKPALGTDTRGEMHLTHLDLSSAVGGTITVEFTETGFISASGVEGFLAEIGGVMNTAPGTSLTYQVFVDGANVAFSNATTVYANTFLPAGGLGAFSASASNALSGLGSPFSMTLVATVTHGGAGATSFDATARVPEPATVALLGMGLLGFAVSRRRRDEKSVA